MGGRYAHIDAARAIAALLVVWQHAAEKFVELSAAPRHAWMAHVAETVDFGRLGVVLFFAISGYVIPWSLKEGAPDAGRTFVIRRAFRLFPAYWLSIPVALLAIWPLLGQTMAPRDVALNFTMVPELLGAQPAIGLYWTLAYELGFYALCLGLWSLGVLHRSWTMLVLLLGAIAAAGLLLVGAIQLERAQLGTASLNCLNFGAMFAGACWRRWLDEGYGKAQRGAGLLARACWRWRAGWWRCPWDAPLSTWSAASRTISSCACRPAMAARSWPFCF